MPTQSSATKTKVAPKRPQLEVEGRAFLYPYYAGFSFNWALEEIRRRELPADALILDPYNGGGTTTTAASICGHHAVGLDMNPAAVVASLARLSGVEAGPYLKRARLGGEPPASTVSLGEQWLAPQSAREFGAVARRLLAFASRDKSIGPDSPTALARVVLFRSLRKLTASFEGSNPTWVRQPRDHRERLRPSREAILATVRQELSEVSDVVCCWPIPSTSAVVCTADARRLPVRNASVDLVLTSPPYCTRIDYAVATLRELSILGYSTRDVESLRRALTGTTLNTRSRHLSEKALCEASKDLLDRITEHPARDSSGYYRRQFQQYLTDASAACKEIARVLKPGGKCVLVVQDSYYQDIHVRLGQIFEQEMASSGLSLDSLEETEVVRNLITLNTQASAARGSAPVSEFVLHMRKL